LLQIPNKETRNSLDDALSNTQKQELISHINQVSLTKQEVGLRVPWYFCTEFAYTRDEHDSVTPIKKFPNIPYLENITQLWSDNQLLLIAKSRQLKITWLMACLHLWLALQPGKLVFLQSKKEEDANAILGRVKLIYSFLPRRMKYGHCDQNQINLNANPKFRDIYCHLEFPWLHSEIIAIPQGPDILRSYTASAIFADEMAFQEQARKAFEAAKPTIDGGGKFTGVSTPNGQEYFYNLLFDIRK